MSESIKVAVPEETLQWLREQYPDAMSDPERVRMAVSDARQGREREEKLAARLESIEGRLAGVETAVTGSGEDAAESES